MGKTRSYTVSGAPWIWWGFCHDLVKKMAGRYMYIETGSARTFDGCAQEGDRQNRDEDVNRTHPV